MSHFVTVTINMCRIALCHIIMCHIIKFVTLQCKTQMVIWSVIQDGKHSSKCLIIKPRRTEGRTEEMELRGGLRKWNWGEDWGNETEGRTEEMELRGGLRKLNWGHTKRANEWGYLEQQLIFHNSLDRFDE